MTLHTIETVTFKLSPDVTKMDFLQTVPASTAFVRARPGFIPPRLSCNESGTWIEHIEWASMKDAKSASAALMKDVTVQPFLHSIDGQNATVQHTQLEVSIG